MTSLATSSQHHTHVRTSLALAFAVAVAPPMCALLEFSLAQRLEANAVLAIAVLAPWWIATPLGLLTTRWTIAMRTVIASALLPFAYVVTTWLALLVAGREHLGGVSSVDAALQLCVVVVLSTIALLAVGLLFGFWLVLPLVPWMTVLRRMRLVPTGDAPAAMFLVAGSSALVESAAIALADHPMTWCMITTALMGAASVAYALSELQSRIRLVRSYQQLDAQSQPPRSKYLPLRLGSDVDDYDCPLAISHVPARPQTYRQEPAELAVALIPSGAKINLGTVLWAWLAPMDKRDMKVLVVCNTIWLVVGGGIIALVKLFG